MPAPDLNSSLDLPEMQSTDTGQDIRTVLVFLREKSWIIALCMAVL
jgi:hypothetical protein